MQYILIALLFVCIYILIISTILITRLYKYYDYICKRLSEIDINLNSLSSKVKSQLYFRDLLENFREEIHNGNNKKESD